MDNEIQIIDNDLTSLELVTRAEYDTQIATAKKYPRSIKAFLDNARAMVTLNEEIASSCIYALPRQGKTIEGASARFAEIILSAWGNCKAGARVISEDAKYVVSQGICHDLQNNTSIAKETKRSIVNKSGVKFNADMIAVTSNAAAAIALRNAILSVIPKAFWQPIYDEAKKVVMGDVKTLSSRRQAALDTLQKFGASQEMVLKKLDIKGVEDITLDHLFILRGIVTAVKEGETTIESEFSNKKEVEPKEPKKDISNKFEKEVATQEQPTDAPNLQDWLDDIKNCPTIEGVEYKLEQCANLFSISDYAKLVVAKDARIAELNQPAKTKTLRDIFVKDDNKA